MVEYHIVYGLTNISKYSAYDSFKVRLAVNVLEPVAPRLTRIIAYRFTLNRLARLDRPAVSLVIQQVVLTPTERGA